MNLREAQLRRRYLTHKWVMFSITAEERDELSDLNTMAYFPKGTRFDVIRREASPAGTKEPKGRREDCER